MKLKLAQIEGILSSPSAQGFLEKDLPIAVSFELARLIKKVSEDYRIFLDKKNEVVNKYAKLDEKGQIIMLVDGAIDFLPENREKANADISTLLDVEISVDMEMIELNEADCPNVSTAELLPFLEVIKLVKDKP